MPTTTGVATSFIDFTRASNATVTDSDGRVKWAPHNLLTNSESFASSPWSTTAASIVSNASTAPNGTSTADAIDADGSGSLHYVQVIASFTYVNAPYTLAAFMKKDTNRYGWISPYDGTSSFGGVFDLQNGVYVGNRTGGGTTAATITPFPNGWYLCTVTYTPAAATTSYPAAFGTNNDGSLGLSDASTGQIFIWGAHLYRSDLGGMQPNTSAYPMYNPTTPKNLLGYTEDFSNAAWSKLNAGTGVVPVVTKNYALAPNGLQVANRVQFDLGATTSTAVSRLFQSTGITLAKAVNSIYLKTNDASTKTLYINNSLGSVISLITVTGEWQRFDVLASTAPTTGQFQFGLSGASSGVPVTTSTTADILAWGAQLSDSASLDSYVPVYGAAVTSAAYYGPRRDFDGATLACKGLLVEEQRTNLVRYSRTLETTGSYWGGLASGTANTITIDNAPGPDGLSTSASMITYNTAVTGAGTYSAWRHTLSTTANGTYTFTIWLKAGTTSSVYLRFSDSGGNRANTLCTLTSSWQRFTVTGTTTATISSIACDVGADGNVGGQTMTAGTVYAYGAQLEAGGFATSYVPNGSTIGGTTRNADLASVSTQAFPYSSAEGTLVANCSFNTGVDIGSYLVQLGGPAGGTSYGSSNSIFRGLNQGLTVGQRLMGLTYDDANSPSYAITAADVNVSPSKVAYGFAANNFGVSVNGATVITDTSGAVPTSATVLTLGSIRGGLGNFLNGHIRQITYLPRRISNTELQTRTA